MYHHQEKQKLWLMLQQKAKDAFINGAAYLEKLASASEVTFLDNKENLDKNLVSVVVKGGELFLPLLDLVDREKELERLDKEKKKLEGEIKRVEGKLSNEKFVSKAPEAVVNEERGER